MTLTSRLEVDRTALEKSKDAVIRVILLAGTHAVQENTRGLELDLEKITRMAVKGRLWRAWGSKAYPKSGPARNPEGVIFVNGGARSQGAIKFFTESGRVKNPNGFFWAIPTEAAGSRGRARDLTPGEWERRTGVKLRFVYRPGKASLLVADNPPMGRGIRRSAGPVVIFTLVPHFDKQNRFAIEPVVRRREGMLKRNFEGKLARSPALK